MFIRIIGFDGINFTSNVSATWPTSGARSHQNPTVSVFALAGGGGSSNPTIGYATSG